VFADESGGRDHKEPLFLADIAKLEQRVIVVTVSVHHDRDRRCSLSSDPGQAFKGLDRHAPAVDRYADHGEFVAGEDDILADTGDRGQVQALRRR
jgi:hypothetical protein